MKANKEAVAERLKSVREDLGLSISMMAERIGTSKANLSSYLRALALPPDEIAQRIADLSGVSKEWLYYGDIKEFMRDYLVSLGYEKFLVDFPETIDEMYIEYEKREMKYPRENSYPSEYEMKSLFDSIYYPIFTNYLNKVAEKFGDEIQKYPIYSGTPQFNTEKYLFRMRDLVRRETPAIKYGEDERVLKIAEKEFNDRVEVYNNNKKAEEKKTEQFLPYLIEKLETDKGVVEIISTLTYMTNQDFYPGTKLSDEVIEIFKEMRPKLIELQENTPEQLQKKTFSDKIKGLFSRN